MRMTILASAAMVDGASDGTSGDDTLSGGRGRDTLQGMAGEDRIMGKAGNDLLVGGDGADSLIGGSGRDTLEGGAGDDVIVGGAQTDVLSGKGGHDVFVFETVFESPGRDPDRIVDLTDNDTIDVSGIDADTTRAGDQAFKIVDQFTNTPGEARLVYNGFPDVRQTALKLDVDGDGRADAVITIDGNHTDFSNFEL